MDTHLDATSGAAILALIAIVATVVAGLFKLLDANTKALNRLATTTAEGYANLTKETKDGNDKAEIRNGHLGESSENIARLIVGQAPTLASIEHSAKDNAESNAEILSTLKESADTLVHTEANKAKAAEGVKTNLDEVKQ